MSIPDERLSFEKVNLGSVTEVYEVDEKTEAAQYTAWLVNKSDWVFYEIETKSGTRTPYPTYWQKLSWR